MTKIAAFLLAALAASVYAGPDKAGPVVQHPAVSPAGSELAFSADFDGSPRIWVASIDGTKMRRVPATSDAGNTSTEEEPSWSPDGRRIAYSLSTGSGSEIWVMQADGSYPQRITSLAVHSTSPTWSPDGQRIVFVSDKDGTKDIWAVDADGRRATKLLASAAEENRPRFSPDGNQIVFSRTDGDKASIMIMNVDGSGIRTVTTGNFRDWDPNWGPRGILFSSDRGGSDVWRIWVVQPDGSGLRKLSHAPGHDPAWLLDGRVVFTDEGLSDRVISGLSVLDPTSGTKQVAVNVQGYHVAIDVRPGKTTNQVNPRSSGRILVSVLSSRTFNATTGVNQNTLTFGRTGSETSLSHCVKPHKDVNGDGIADLSCRFVTRATGFQDGSTSAVLRFIDSRGQPREGRDLITTVVEEDLEDLNY